MKLKEKLKKIFLYSVTIDNNDKRVSRLMEEENRRFSIIWSIAQIFYWAYCLVMSFFNDLFTRCRYVYIVALALCLILLVLIFTVSKKVPIVNFVIKYAISITLLVVSVSIAWILFQTDDMTIMLFVSVILVPILFINNTLTNIIMIASNIVFAAILFKIGNMSNVTYAYGISNLVVFSSMGVTLGHFVNKSRIERYAFSESAVELAKLQTMYACYDQLTGLQNRRAYSDKIDQLSNASHIRCAAIMVDINGLKVVNDTLGHEAGDELITGTAECLRHSFEEIEDIYRLGGDEFCVLVTNEKRDLEKDVKVLEETCKKWRGRYVDKLSVSYGLATSEEFDTLYALLKAADQRMYEYKNNYYRTSGVDRRKY